MQGKGTHHHALDHVMSRWGIRCFSESNSIDFTFILIGSLRKVKSGFHYVSLLASGLEEGGQSHKILGEHHNFYGSGF